MISLIGWWKAGRKPLVWAALVLALARGASGQQPDRVLSGQLDGDRHHQKYVELPFSVPADLQSLTVEFEYDRIEGATIDLGLRDPTRFRGWSGGNKARFTVGLEASTPSYLNGPMPEGNWHLILGVPNLRAGTSTEYRASIYFRRAASDSEAPSQTSAVPKEDSRVDDVLSEEARWYRGDLHVHSGHSDGSCLVGETAAERGPCPLKRTIDVARERGLDFVSFTEHNTTSQYAPLARRQAAYRDLLLIPGREVTTFFGHANVYGTTRFLEFALGSDRLPTIDGLLDDVEEADALISINHPGLPSGELCMGCGWTVVDTPWERFQLVEVVNGGAMKNRRNRMDGPLSGIPFWTQRLNEGHRLIAVGGSDNHDPDVERGSASAVGRPTTVVFAEALSTSAILDGLRRGRVFVDLGDHPERHLDYVLVAEHSRAAMGEILQAKPGVSLSLVVEVRGSGTPTLVGSGISLSPWESAESRASQSTPGRRTFQFKGFVPRLRGGSGSVFDDWLRVELRDADGHLVAIGNPVFLKIVE